MIKIAPSILAADFAAMGQEVASLQAAGADLVHVDVMDGRFVPNISLGQGMVQAIRRNTALPLDVHLMIEEPERYIGEFAAAGADVISIHAEATRHLHRALGLVREAGAKAGVVLNPATSPEALRYILDKVDLVLVMTVNPGFAGQKLVPATLGKITRLRRMLDENGYDNVRIEVDGNVSFENAVKMRAAGADLFVAGTSAVFREGGIEANMKKLLECIR